MTSATMGGSIPSRSQLNGLFLSLEDFRTGALEMAEEQEKNNQTRFDNRADEARKVIQAVANHYLSIFRAIQISRDAPITYLSLSPLKEIDPTKLEKHDEDQFLANGRDPRTRYLSFKANVLCTRANKIFDAATRSDIQGALKTATQADIEELQGKVQEIVAALLLSLPTT